MRIESVTAHAFGPLVGQSLELAPGVTVVYGPNESAKSSWHAATYAALCGRGAPQSSEERRFAEKHKPWDRADWLVEARVRLDDNRRVRLRQNLVNNADRQAIDLDLGRDVSSEIMHDQYPDAAIWLGLNRESFRVTACVAQAQILDVVAGSGDLTGFLQAAAATGGGQPVEAIKRLEKFQGERVGRPRMKNPPLVRARLAHEQAIAALAEARDRHARYELAAAAADRARQARERAQALLAREEWLSVAASAAGLLARAERARELSERIEALAVDDAGASVVDPGLALAEARAALIMWRDATARPADAASPSTAAADAPVARPAGEASVGELWGLVAQLEEPVPVAGPGVAERLGAARSAWQSARTAAARAWGWLVAGLALAAAGAGLVVAGQTLIGLGLLAVALIPSGVGALGLRAGARAASARAELDQAEQEAARAAGVLEMAGLARARAVARCDQLGVPADPTELRRRIAEVERLHATEVLVAGRRDDALLQAETTVLAAAKRLDLSVDTPGDAVNAIEARLASAADVDDRRQRVAPLRVRLAAELGDSTLPELIRLTGGARERAAALRAAVPLTALAADERELDGALAERLATGPATAGADEAAQPRWAELHAGARAAEAEARAAEIALREASPTLGVGDAEEREAAAAALRQRLEELDDTLSRTIEFMTEAQEWAHRTVAPSLNEALRSTLPVVTRGRYTEVAIDPNTLEVTVWGEGGANRRAARLSHGTAEQIYLLLRIALAEYLVRDGVSCPLLFDDVTVHADRERTAALLDLLLAASQRHQVVIFTQQDQVRDWALSRLGAPEHSVIELPALD